MRTVGLVDSFVKIFHLENRQNRSKRFLCHDTRIVRSVHKDGRQIEKAFLEFGTIRTLAANQDPGTTFHRVGDLRFDLFALNFRVHRPQACALVHAIADRKLLNFPDELLHKLVINAFDNIEPFHRKARLSAIVKTPNGCACQCLIDVGIVANDHWIRATEFERDALHQRACHLHNMLAGLALAGKRHAADLWVAQYLLSHNAARSGHQIKHSLGKSRLVQQLNDSSARQRCR